MDFKLFDNRNYPTVPTREGYAQWAATYEDSVLDLMDLRLLERLSVDWNSITRCADLACGTGRTAAWLSAAGVNSIDGVDITPEMLDRARKRGIHASLHTADIRDTPLHAGTYDLITCCLADEHLPHLEPLYTEAARIASPLASLVLVGYHPFIAMGGMPTHFHQHDGQAVAIETYVHLFSDHVAAAGAAGWTLAEMHESVIDDDWLAIRPRWADRKGRPVSFAFVWKRAAVAQS